jgi:AmmeMemoRadiSam system protein B
MSQVRPPAVAGTFYPGEETRLAAAVRGYLEAAAGATKTDSRLPVPKAIIVPHAGYVYSAPVAARAFTAVRSLAGQVSRVVLIGPAHFVHFRGIAAPAAGSFETPLGALVVDRAAVEAIADMPEVVVSDAARAREDSLEVQLPFIREVLGEVGLVPLAVGDVESEAVSRVIERLWGGPETLVIVSSDLSHYHAYAAARHMDAVTAAAIEALDGARLGPEDACGYCGVAALLSAARRRGLVVERLDLRNSGDTAGPRDQVVGYGAWLLR